MDSKLTKTDIIPHIANPGYKASFAQVDMKKRAIASRGFNPLNQAHLIDLEIFFLNPRIFLDIPGWMIQMKRPFRDCLQCPPYIRQPLLRLRMHHFGASIQRTEWMEKFLTDFSRMSSVKRPGMRGGGAEGWREAGENPLNNVGVCWVALYLVLVIFVSRKKWKILLWEDSIRRGRQKRRPMSITKTSVEISSPM